jgi:hypothetical protein
LGRWKLVQDSANAKVEETSDLYFVFSHPNEFTINETGEPEIGNLTFVLDKSTIPYRFTTFDGETPHTLWIVKYEAPQLFMTMRIPDPSRRREYPDSFSQIADDVVHAVLVRE